MKFVIKPLLSRIFVRRFDEKTEGTHGESIYLPRNASRSQQHGEIVAIGPGELLQDGTYAPVTAAGGHVLKVGDHVLFVKQGGADVELEGEVLAVMDPGHIWAVLTPDLDQGA